MSARSRVVQFFPNAAHPTLAALAAAEFAALAAKLGLPYTAEVVADITVRATAAAKVVTFGPPTTLVLGSDAEAWPADASAIPGEVADLAARLVTGAKRDPAARAQVATAVEVATKPAKPKKPPVVRLGRETKGRRGKGVTLVSDLPTHLTEPQIAELATALKNRCGTGGTVRDKVIEIQGDMRDRVEEELVKLGYAVKRVGG